MMFRDMIDDFEGTYVKATILMISAILEPLYLIQVQSSYKKCYRSLQGR